MLLSANIIIKIYRYR